MFQILGLNFGSTNERTDPGSTMDCCDRPEGRGVVCTECGETTCVGCYLSKEIDPAFSGDLCPNHRHECHVCERVDTEEEIAPCSECGREACRAEEEGCAGTCRTCEDLVCDDCQDHENGYFCSTCGVVTCKDHIPSECASEKWCIGDGRVCECGTRISCPGTCGKVWCSEECIDDLINDKIENECTRCGAPACKDCIAECSGCSPFANRLLCPECAAVCGSCGDPVCLEHAQRCEKDANGLVKCMVCDINKEPPRLSLASTAIAV